MEERRAGRPQAANGKQREAWSTDGALGGGHSGVGCSLHYTPSLEKIAKPTNVRTATG